MSFYDWYWIVCINIEKAVFSAIGFYPPISWIWFGLPGALLITTTAILATIQDRRKSILTHRHE